MDLESDFLVLESVEDNEGSANDCVSENLGSTTESLSKIQNNGSYLVGNYDDNELFPDLKQKGAEVSGNGDSPPMDLKPEVSPSSSSTKRGYGLRKWRRIRRDPIRDGESSIDTSRMVAPDMANSVSVVNPSKRTQYSERKQKSEGSVSSTNAVVRSLDCLTMLDGSALDLGLPFATGTDSENSEERSSKSSTAASAPKIKYEIPAVAGFPRDRSRIRSLSGKNLAHQVQRSKQGKGRTETTKKATGERVKIEKENSHSSMESDSRSSNFVFMQGNYSLNNGIRNERPNGDDEENSDEVTVSGQQVNEGHRSSYAVDGEVGFEDVPPKDDVADSSWGVKSERTVIHGSTRQQDPLDESIIELQSAQDALEKELFKFKEIGNNVPVSDLCTDFTSSEQSQDGEGLRSSSRALQSEEVEIANRDAVAEIEDLFKQKVETEVEYLAISRKVQKLKIAAADQITVFKEQKALASEQTQILNKLGVTETNVAVLKKEAELLDKICEDFASADEVLKLQKRVRRCSYCFLLQLALLLIILGFFCPEDSASHVQVVPT